MEYVTMVVHVVGIKSCGTSCAGNCHGDLAEKYGVCNLHNCGTWGTAGCYTSELMFKNETCYDKLIYGANDLCKDDRCGSINEPPSYAGTLRSISKTGSSAFNVDVMIVHLVP